MKASVKPNGQTKQIAGKTANGYDMEITVPATMGGANGMKMTVTLTGPMWIVKGAPGTAEYINFYKSAVEKGWFFSDPRAAKGTARPGQGDGGDVPPARGNRRHSVRAGNEHQDGRRGSDGGPDGQDGQHLDDYQTCQSVETGALAADLFAAPAGYKLKEQK